jgi:hypothetical protein
MFLPDINLWLALAFRFSREAKVRGRTDPSRPVRSVKEFGDSGVRQSFTGPTSRQGLSPR